MIAVASTRLRAERVPFGGLEIAFDAGVLHPRPWTVLQAEWAAELAKSVPTGPILELCSGVGHIGLLAAVLSGRRLVQVDSDAGACAFAELNAFSAGIDRAVEVRCRDIASALWPSEEFPLILADPPYIPTADVGRFPDDPRTAIDGGEDGLSVIRACLYVAGAHLSEDGACLLQVRGPSQVAALRPIAEDRGLAVLATRVVDEERAIALLGREGREGRRS